VSYEDARNIQNWLKGRVVLNTPGDVSPNSVTCVGVRGRWPGEVKVAAATYEWPKLKVKHAACSLSLHSVPPFPQELEAFSLAPIVIDAIEDLCSDVELLVVEGHGINHIRRFGLASHIGILTDTMTVGVATEQPWGIVSDQEIHIVGEEVVFTEEHRRIIEALELPMDPTDKVYDYTVGKVVGNLYAAPGHLISVEDAARVAAHLLRNGVVPTYDGIMEDYDKQGGIGHGGY